MTTHWNKASIRDLVLPTKNWNPSREPRSAIKYVDVSSVSRETLEIISVDEMAAALAPSRARKTIKTNDTLFATIRPTLKRVAQVPSELNGEIASTAFCILRPNSAKVDADFLFFIVSSDSFVESVADLQTGASYPAVRDSDVLDQEILIPEAIEQKALASALKLVRAGLLQQSESLKVANQLKQTTMHKLFTCGLRGEPQKETEIGLVPEGWDIKRLDSCAKVVSTRMSYSELESLEDAQGEGVNVAGIKVSDMNTEGNESIIAHARVERTLPAGVVKKRCAPPGTIVFPKRGAAIATNKKRFTTTWSVFDPNVIGVLADSELNSMYLFYWFQMFNLQTITEPGPTPQLNKKHLDPLSVQVPPTSNEQQEIVDILDAVDQKIDLQRRKKAVLEELFKSLLHKLMTGEVHVDDLDLSALEHSHAVAGESA